MSHTVSHQQLPPLYLLSKISISTLEKYEFLISLSTLESRDQNFKFLFLLSKFEIGISHFSFYSRNSRSESRISLSTLKIRDQNFKFLFLLSKFKIRISNISFYSRIYFFDSRQCLHCSEYQPVMNLLFSILGSFSKMSDFDRHPG